MFMMMMMMRRMMIFFTRNTDNMADIMKEYILFYQLLYCYFLSIHYKHLVHTCMRNELQSQTQVFSKFHCVLQAYTSTTLPLLLSVLTSEFEIKIGCFFSWVNCSYVNLRTDRLYAVLYRIFLTHTKKPNFTYMDNTNKLVLIP